MNAIKSRDEKSRALLHPAVTHEHFMTSSVHYTSLSDVDFDVSTTKKSPFVGGIIAAVVVVIVVVVVTVPVAVIYGKNGSTTMCLSAECIKLSATVRAALDQTVDPCTDFYNFSCGNWIKNTTIPSASSLYNNFALLTTLNSKDLEYAVSNQLGGTNVQALLKLHNLYMSCLSSNINNIQFSLANFLSEIDGWPLINISAQTTWSLNGDQFIQEKLLNSPAFFTLNISVSPTDRTEHSIYVYNSGLTLSSPLRYNDSTMLARLKSLISNTLQVLNPNNSLSYYQIAALRIVAVEQALAQVSPTGPNIQDYRVTTLGYLGSLWTDYLWIKQTSTIFNEIGVQDIFPNEPIVLYGEMYFSQLYGALGNFSNTDLQNYAKWQLLYTWMPYLNDDIVNDYYQFQLLNNPLAQVPSTRNQACINVLQRVMPYALGRVFAERILPNNSKDTAAQMMTNILQKFRTRIGSQTWLDQQTISIAQNKIDLMLTNIAYPDLTFNDTWLNLIYENLTVSADNFQGNLDSYLTDIVPSSLVLLRQPYDQWKWNTPTTVNAYYQPTMNSIYILEGIMRPPFFHPEWPMYFQYGSMGVVLGHEITHGFDNHGRLYDATGQLDNLWTQYSINNFISRQQCYIDEYSNLSLFGIADNGTNTLPENIADNGGLITSYMAYQTAKQKNSAIQLLPDLNYTDEQLFFIAFGQLWCSYLTEEAVQYLVQNYVHSPGPLRVIGTVMNSAEFANAFKCPSGSPMDPPNKCSLW